jgi:hypothetical protein
LPEVVGDDEDLARLLTSSSHFATGTNRVKGAALLPDSRRNETSVYRHGVQPADPLWRIGREIVAGDRRVHGAAIFKAKHVRAVALDVFAAEPPPRHAAIRGWPTPAGDPELAKARRKELATAIAEHAQLFLVSHGEL